MPKTYKDRSASGASEELENRYRKAHDPVERSHYQILWLIGEGNTTTRVMEVTGYSRGWIQQLARRYNASGPEALGDRRHHNPGARDRALHHPRPTRRTQRGAKGASSRRGDVELAQGWRVDRA